MDTLKKMREEYAANIKINRNKKRKAVSVIGSVCK
jgi:hypothetical protein